MIPADSGALSLPGNLREMGSPYVAMHYCGNQARWHISTRRARVVAALLGLERGHVLDVGCGPGYSSSLVARRVDQVTAVDIDPVKLSIAEAIARLNGVKVDTSLVDASSPLPFETGRFDGVISLELVEHLKDWRAAVLEMCRVVRPGGRVAISTPTRTGAAQLLKSTLLTAGLMAETTYEKFIPRSAMISALEAGGVEVTGVEFAILAAPMLPDAAMAVVRPIERLVESIPMANRLCSTAIYCGIRR